MWCVVVFDKDNTVEAIPSSWFKNGLCAWPKKDERVKIKRRIQPNKFDFDFYPARILQKGIGSLLEARSKLKIAEVRSDLSACEENVNCKKVNKNISLLRNPPKFSPAKYCKIDSLVKSPMSKSKNVDQLLNNSAFSTTSANEQPLNIQRFNTSSIQETGSKFKVDNEKFHLLKKKTYVNKQKSIKMKSLSDSSTLTHSIGNDESDISNGEDNDNFDNDPTYALPEKNLSHIMTIGTPTKSQTGSSKHFNKALKNCIPSTSTIQQPHKEFFSQGRVYQKNNKNTPSVKRKLSFDHSSGEDSYVIHTSASPFKVTKVASVNALGEGNVVETNPTLLDSSILKLQKQQNDQSSMTHDCSLKYNQILEIVNKTLKVVLKTKYDVETIDQKQDRLEKILSDSVLHKEISYSQQLCNNQLDNCFEMLPIKDEDGLIEFENKLSVDKTFRSNLVLELKRNAKRNLTATVRQILRFLYDDCLLKDYSFKGQKSKKVFSTLISCSVIFEAVRKIKQYENVTNTDIQTPLTVYIAGATFRINKKND